METYIVVGAVLYWTFAVVIAIKALSAYDSFDLPFVCGVIAVSVFWPITAVIAGIALLYSASVSSTEQLRNDLHNRQLLHEFEQWLKQRK